MLLDGHTFVVCAYKESAFLEECIQSLIKQNYKSEVVLYTSTLNDYIDAICKKYDVEIFTSDEEPGIGHDWNKSLSCVRTKYATIAHQDDIYLPDYSQKIMDGFINHKDTLISFSNYQEWKNNEVLPHGRNLKIKSTLLKIIGSFPKSKRARLFSLSLGNIICCPAVSYNMELLPGFQFDEGMRTNLDWEAWYRIANLDGRFHYVSETLMYHRIHEESETTNTISDNTRTKEDKEMFEKFWPSWVANFLMRFYIKSQDTNN